MTPDRNEERRQRRGQTSERIETSDVPPNEGERKVENATPRGRYGSAPEGRPHVSPEVAPATGGDVEARPTRPQSGSLPENEGENVDETTTGRQ